MKEMRDSTHHAADGQALRTRMDADGYLLIRGVLDADLIGTVRSDVLGALRRAEWIAEDGSLRPLIGGDEDPRYWAGFAGVQALESFHQMAFDPILSSIMSALIGPDMFPWPGKAPYMIWPEELAGPGGSHAQPHQEGVRWSRDVLSTWISIGRTPVEQGALAVLPGTNTLEYLPGYAYGAYEFGPEWATTGFEPGDVVIFHNFTLHGSLPNRMDTMRLSCAFKWQSARFPAPEEASLPVRYPGVPGWDSLTKGWSSRRWITPPKGVVFTPKPPPRDAASDGSAVKELAGP